jgi:hypothetical protein
VPASLHASLPSFPEAFGNLSSRSTLPHHGQGNAVNSASVGPHDASPRSDRGPGRGNLLPPFSTLEKYAGGAAGELTARPGEGGYLKPGSPPPIHGFLASAFASRRSSADESAGGSTVAGAHSPLPRLQDLRLPEHRGRLPASVGGLCRPVRGNGRTNSVPAAASPRSGSESVSLSPASLASSPARSPIASFSSSAPEPPSPGLHATRGPSRVGKKKTKWGSASSTSGAAAAVAAAVAAVVGDDATASGATGTGTGTDNEASPVATGREQRRDAKNETEKVRRTNGTAWLREMQVRLERLQWAGSLLSQANHRKSKGLLKYNKLEIMQAFVGKFDEYERLAGEGGFGRCGACAGCRCRIEGA